MSETHKRCPFCGGTGEIEEVVFPSGSTSYRARCKNCDAMCKIAATKVDAWKRWDHRASDCQCAGCRHFEVSSEFSWCRQTSRKREASDFCSRWEKA